MDRDKRKARRKMEAAMHHLARAYEMLHGASATRPLAAVIGDSVAHLNEEIRREVRAIDESAEDER
jgi:hypothetical protein